MPTVVLHIGAMKTGTSYVQQVLSVNRDVLAQQGVRWLGKTWFDQVEAVEQLMATRRNPQGAVDRWEALAAEAAAHDGPLAVVSMEFLSFATPEVAQRAVAAFEPNRVRVVLTLRDLARVLPAQWQELTQNRRDWTYRDYLAGVTARRPADNPCWRHFWYRQRWPRMLAAWQPTVAKGDFVVVTVPQSGAPPRLLMDRVAQAAGYDPDPLDLDVFGNDSLGAVSAELMRRVTHEAGRRELTPAAFKALKFDLAKNALSLRRRSEPTIVLPRRVRSWVDRTSRELVEDVRVSKATMVGDLDELLPHWPDEMPPNATDDPQQVGDDLLLEAALDGLVALQPAPRRKGT